MKKKDVVWQFYQRALGLFVWKEKRERKRQGREKCCLVEKVEEGKVCVIQ